MSSNATAIAIFEVDSGDRERVLTWQADLDAAAARSIGFVGAHFTRGFDEHDDWAAAVTFNSAANLRKWLDSAFHQARCSTSTVHLGTFLKL